MGEFVATFDYDPAGNPNCIALSAGDRITVMDTSREDWWIGYKAGEGPASAGSFPKAFVAPAPVPSPALEPAPGPAPEPAPEPDPKPEPEPEPELQPQAQPSAAAGSFVAAHDYDPAGTPGCLPLAAGDVVTVTNGTRDDWWVGYKESDPSAVGNFPKAYVLPSPREAPGSTRGRAGSTESPVMPPHTPRTATPAQTAATMVALVDQVSAVAKQMIAAQTEPPTQPTNHLVRQIIIAALDDVGCVAAGATPRIAAAEGVPPPAASLNLQHTTSPDITSKTADVGAAARPAMAETPPPRPPRAATPTAVDTAASPRLPADLQSHIQQFSVDSYSTIHFKRRRTKGFLGIFGRRLLSNEEIAAHSDEPLTKPLLESTPKAMREPAIANFRHVQCWMDEGSGGATPADRGACPAFGARQWEAAGLILRLAWEDHTSRPLIVSNPAAVAVAGDEGEAGVLDEIYVSHSFGHSRVAHLAIFVTPVDCRLARHPLTTHLTPQLQVVKQSATNPCALRRARGFGLLCMLGCVALPSTAVRTSLTALADKLVAAAGSSDSPGPSSSSSAGAGAGAGAAVQVGTGGVDEHTKRLLGLLLWQLASVAPAAGPGAGGVDCPLLPAACMGGTATEMLRGYVVTTACEAVLPNVFGISLDGLILRDTVFMTVPRKPMSTQDTHAVPAVLEQLIAAVRELGGHETQGIYRVTAESARIEELLAHLDTGVSLEPPFAIAAGSAGEGGSSSGSLARTGSSNPSVAAAALKRWLGSLPEPLIPTALYGEAMTLAAHGDLGAHTAAVRGFCQRLPPSHHATLRRLCCYLQELATTAHEVTSMNATNLATVFAPNLLRMGRADEAEVMGTMEGRMRILKNAGLAIKLVEQLVVDPPPALDSAAS
eukprot:COSAG05_NODE_1414_length_4943_cov_9.634806_3_plen_885_part_00